MHFALNPKQFILPFWSLLHFFVNLVINYFQMKTTAIKKQFDGYLPLLTNKQQELLLEMVKSFLNVDKDTKRITRKQYNKEINDAVARIEKGNFVKHGVALKELSKW